MSLSRFLTQDGWAKSKRNLSSGSAKGGEGEGLNPERHAISKAVDSQKCMWKTIEGGDFKCSRIIARAMQVY